MDTGGETVTAETINLSASGAYCRVDQPIPLMTTLKIILHIPDDSGTDPSPITADGVVVRTEADISDISLQNEYNIAIFFNEIDEPDRARLIAYVNRQMP